MRKNTLLTLFMLLTSASLCISQAQAASECRSLDVAAAEIPFFVESPNDGVFIDLIRTAAARADIDIKIAIFPKKRALSLFQKQRKNALLPHSSAGVELAAFKSDPILTKRDFVFVRRGTPIPRNIRDLEGLRIGLTQQYAYPEALISNDRVRFSREPASDLENIKMLSLGRLDGSVIEERSGLKAIAESGADNITYDRTSPINELLVWMLFKNDACGKQHMEKLNAAFAAMRSNGEWQSILRQSGPKS